MSSTTNTAPTTPTVAGVAVLTVRIPGDRGEALALYAKVKTACDEAWSIVTSRTGADYQPAMDAWLASYKYPRMAFWNRIAAVHQGGQGLTGQGNDHFRKWVADHK